MKSVMPSTFSSCGCKRRITSLALILRCASGFQIHLNAASVERRVRPVNADEGRETIHSRILEDDVRKRLLVRGHRAKRNGLRRFRDAENDAGVLNGEKSFGDVNIEKNRATSVATVMRSVVARYCRTTFSVRP